MTDTVNKYRGPVTMRIINIVVFTFNVMKVCKGNNNIHIYTINI